uniref:Dual specificity phosphatase catalytic domain-containing protein n=1 Tax=Panagrolaimus sp. ES5 TaxID=591445 RepID=A0AC34FQ69_9BILA
MMKFFQSSEIRPNLHITGYGRLSDEKIKKLGYTHAVDVTNVYKIHSKNGIKYFNVNVDDNATTDITKYFNEAANFIQDAVDGV